MTNFKGILIAMFIVGAFLTGQWAIFNTIDAASHTSVQASNPRNYNTSHAHTFHNVRPGGPPSRHHR
jgi:hypothetical protein